MKEASYVSIGVTNEDYEIDLIVINFLYIHEMM